MYYAILFLVLGVIAGGLHLAGVAVVTAPMSWVVFGTGTVLYVITERPGRVV